MASLSLKNIEKIYPNGFKAVQDFNLEIADKEFIIFVGPSGCGKTTLLNIIATLDKATSGVLSLNGKDIATLKSNEIARFRRKELGFVFQDFNLLDQFCNKDNIYLPLVLSEEKVSLMDERLDEIKDRLGIGELLDKYPYEISGGQKQRIAIARAIITKPSLLLADEPTGALDSTSSEMILNLFRQVNEDGQTVLVVTHSLRAASYAKRVLFIKDGIVFHEIYRGENEAQGDFMERISQAEFMLGRGKKL